MKVEESSMHHSIFVKNKSGEINMGAYMIRVNEEGRGRAEARPGQMRHREYEKRCENGPKVFVKKGKGQENIDQWSN